MSGFWTYDAFQSSLKEYVYLLDDQSRIAKEGPLFQESGTSLLNLLKPLYGTLSPNNVNITLEVVKKI